MKFLDRFGSSTPSGSVHTTAQVFLGAPEAEAETGANAKIHLSDAFEDYFGVLSDLKTPKFVVSGRKGSGKSAIGAFISLKAANSPNVFVAPINKTDIDLEKLLQIIAPLSSEVHAGVLLEWVILVKLAELLLKNESLKNDEGSQSLARFFDRNRGVVSLSALELHTLVTTKSGELGVGLFNRAVHAVLGRKLEFKSERAPFYKLIPHLKDVVFALLKDYRIRDHGADYVLVFDDLDVGLNAGDDGAMLRLGALIRLCRDYNKLLSSDNLSAKIIVLLRDDITVALANREADLGKIIQSYNSRITWWGTKLFGPDENNSEIKKFITRRISIALRMKGIGVDSEQAWDYFVNPHDDWGLGRTSFKYVLDHTLYRPRDLVLMFLDIDKLNFKLPLDKREFDEVILPKYASRLMTEWRNELLFVMTPGDVAKVVADLPAFTRSGSPFTCDQFAQYFRTKLSIEPTHALNLLFLYSLVGHIDHSQRVFFTHRQDPENPTPFDSKGMFTFHKAILLCAHFKHSGF